MKSKSNKGTKALKRYRKSKKRKSYLDNNPDIVLYVIVGCTIIGGIAANITKSIFLGSLTSMFCGWLSYLWFKGKIL